MAAPYILARTLREAHAFAREELGLARGRYRIVTAPGTIKSARGTELYLVPGYRNRFDKFAMKGAIRWTRLNVIDVAEVRRADALEQFARSELIGTPDDLHPAGVQLTLDEGGHDWVIPVTHDEATSFITNGNGDNMISEGSPVAPEQAEEPDRTGQRRSRCKKCGTLHYRDETCNIETIPLWDE